MHKMRSILEVTIGERSFKLECAPESTLGEIYDALSQMKSFVIEKMKEAEEASKVKENG